MKCPDDSLVFVFFDLGMTFKRAKSQAYFPLFKALATRKQQGVACDVNGLFGSPLHDVLSVINRRGGCRSTRPLLAIEL